jgi:serine protease Do
VIMSFDGQSITAPRDLSRRVANASIDSRHELALWREGKQKAVEVRLGTPPDQQTMAEAGAEAGGTTAESLGLQLAALDAIARAQAGLPDDVQGVLVVNVTGDAAETVQPGDVIVSVDRQAVRTPAEVAAKVQQAEQAGHKAVLLLLTRDGNQRFAALELGHA